VRVRGWAARAVGKGQVMILFSMPQCGSDFLNIHSSMKEYAYAYADTNLNEYTRSSQAYKRKQIKWM
jgi:hypothetical protein